MILTCPECATHYKAKSTAIGVNGRTVRCRKCTATWFVAAPEDKFSTPDELQLEDIKADSAPLSEIAPPNSPNVQTRVEERELPQAEEPHSDINRADNDVSGIDANEVNTAPSDVTVENTHTEQTHQEERRKNERRRIERRQSFKKPSFGHSNVINAPIEPEQTNTQPSDMLPSSSEDEMGETRFQAKTADVIMRDRADEAKLRSRMRIIRVIWAIPLTLICLILLGLFFARQTVVQAFPGTASVYKAVGLKVSPTGLLVDPPIIKTAKVNGIQTIIINGSVKNITKKTKTLPPLILSLHNAQGDPVAEWWVEFNVQTLEGQERVEFASDYPNPPLDGKELRYRLGFDAPSFQ